MGSNCCLNWYGISCNATTGRVSDINLHGESEDPIFEKVGRSGYMNGKFSPAICDVDTLTTLVLSGEIPADVDKLSCLTVLNLADNALSGKIPASITRLGSLKHLDLINNQFYGEIPEDFGNLAMLSRMLLSRNQLICTSLRESYGEYVWLREGERAGVR
ncbi:hypothetical protein GYH30_042946 [Glycine max]|nr:hypothetical protein GYH30_042946 [Glycine max]